MTLIVYAKGELVADQAGITELPAGMKLDHGLCIPVSMVKLHVSRDNKIAFAYTGEEIDFTSSAFKKQLLIFRRVLSKINGGTDSISIRTALLDEYGDIAAYVMTSQQCYIINDVKRDQHGLLSAKLDPISHEVHYCHGSGRDIADLLLNTNSVASLDDLYVKVSIFDCAVSPYPLNRVKHSDLKPLP